jgi:hypothetical protein
MTPSFLKSLNYLKTQMFHLFPTSQMFQNFLTIPNFLTTQNYLMILTILKFPMNQKTLMNQKNLMSQKNLKFLMIRQRLEHHPSLHPKLNLNVIQ